MKIVSWKLKKDTLKQTWVISGTVKAASDGTPLPNVTVMIKGSTVDTQTDIEGVYKLDISQFTNQSGVTLVLSFIGMKTYEQKITIRDVVCDVTMKEDENGLSGEVIVIGRNPIKRTWWRTKSFFKRIF